MPEKHDRKRLQSYFNFTSLNAISFKKAACAADPKNIPVK
jgi:hypothetical protein